MNEVELIGCEVLRCSVALKIAAEIPSSQCFLRHGREITVVIDLNLIDGQLRVN
jgi:hypothetical protein